MFVYSVFFAHFIGFYAFAGVYEERTTSKSRPFDMCVI